MIKAHIYFSGTVQGVGFRYTTQRYAGKIGLNGWVKNLVDGRVEIMVDGDKGKIEHLIESLNKHFGRYIQNCDVSYSGDIGGFTNFQIEH